MHRFTQLLAPHSAANSPVAPQHRRNCPHAHRSRAKKVLQSLFCCPAGYYACVRAADQRKRKFTLHCIISSLALTVGQPHASRRNRRAGNRKATKLLAPSTRRKYVCYVPSQLKWCMQSLQGGASGLALSLDYIDLTISAVRLVLLGQL